MTGLHRSPRKGFSVEFAEHRPYLPGDDLRYLDWKIAARSDRWVIKQFEEETNLRATIVLDVSRSMDWSGAADRLTKSQYAERMVAAVSLLLLRQRDAVGLVRFDANVRSSVPARARTGQWRRIVTALAEPGGAADSVASIGLEQAARLVRRAGLVILVSDLLLDRDPVERAIRGLVAAGHSFAVLHVMDPAERDLPPGGDTVFVDSESGEETPASPADVRDAYRDTVAREIAAWRDALGAAGAAYATVMTDEPFGIPLRHAFAARQRRS